MLCRRERHGQRIGSVRQLWVSSLAGDDRVNDAPSPLHTSRRDPAGSVTSGEQRENVATAVLFISGEDERMKRATLVKKALRPMRTYIVE